MPETIAINKNYLIYALIGVIAIGLIYAASQGYISAGIAPKADIKNPEQASAAIVDVGSDIQNLDRSMADIEKGLK